MIFANPWFLLGLGAVLAPVILHLIRRQAAKPYDWGAMQFLRDTVVTRRRRMEWEELLLMAARCLLLALVALALARPIIPPDSQTPWFLVLPVLLFGIALFGASFVFSAAKKRWLTRLVALVLLALSGGAVYFAEQLNLARFQTSPRRDIALVIDASSSMTLARGKKTAFALAVDEARDVVKKAPKGCAFSVILGGPTPEAKTATPLTHRADVLEVLDSLRPVGGPFRAQDALGVATLGLAQGGGAAKDIMVFSDSQRRGWRLENPAGWEKLAAAWAGMAQKPRLILRSFDFPEKVRNVTLTGLEFSREVVGTDRDLLITAKLENTGTEALTPGLVNLDIGGQSLEPLATGQLLPGQEERVQFRHRFSKAGPKMITARVESDDDLAADDRFERALIVRDRLPVLLVDGNPGGGFFERATGYTALALAPTDALFRGEKSERTAFMDPVVTSASALAAADLDAQSVLVLADVSRLPPGVAARLANFVARGGGLLILAGEKSEPAFYNSWSGADGLLSPLVFDKLKIPAEAVHPAPATFSHPALRLFKNAAGADLQSALITGYLASSGLAKGGIPAARFSDGGIFMAARNYGQGRVMAVSTGFDARLGNLPVRQSFVPLVHELVAWLGGARDLDLNISPAWNPSLQISGGNGLVGKYYQTRGERAPELRLERIDANLDFDWENAAVSKKLPADNFEVRWSGGLVAPASGEFLFDAEVDDRLSVKLDDKVVLRERENGKSEATPFTMKKGKTRALDIEYEEDRGAAFVRLFWTRPDGKREIVPASAFSPVNPASGDLVLGKASAIDPRGETRKAELVIAKGGKTLQIAGPPVPGPYLVDLGDLGEDLAAELELKKTKLPFVVEREAAESRLIPFSEDDLAFLRKETNLVHAGSAQDILAVLSGKGFGREVWKILALAAFALLLLESALARWVSGARKLNEEARVDFEDSGKPDSAFLHELEKVKTKG